MPTIKELQDEIIEDFAALDDWMDRYALLIDLGGELAPLPETDKTPTNLIEGCQSRVWITASYDGERVHYRGESDALIVKGIVSLLLRVLDDQRPEDIINSELYFIKEIGLSEHLSPTRSNGLVAMLRQMRLFAATFAAQG
ncbi:SufE family protein [Porphyromonas sp. oral taxon 275]|jgi:probable sufE Fe/S-cluster-related protein|uniref:SufE family protein n=1 Tax=Porphyromonas sp. oral taxon 275 TaxID=712435 RepID=UPI001BACC376|nr:SufE family protein [Porphyromonas sp. oral taxon 275]QUB43248.1 SufE family protein [Porphyromonas sp. oral taxon 275]